MQIWVNPASYKQATQYIVNTIVDVIIIGTKDFSLRNNCCVSLEQIAQLSKINSKTRIAILINKIFFEHEINGLIIFMKALKELNIKEIIFSDYGVKQICDEINYYPTFTYHSETLVTGYGQFDFFNKNGINQVVLARELFLNEIKQIGKNKNKTKIQVQIEGYSFIMHSKWKLLEQFSNYSKITDDLKNKKLYIKENERNLANIIFEDENGVHLFTGYNLSGLGVLKELIECNIDSIRIDSFLNDEKWVDSTVLVYKKAIDIIKSGLWIENNINKLKNEITKINIDPVSLGFFGSAKDLLHLKKIEDENE